MAAQLALGEAILGCSAAIDALRRCLPKIASSDAPVLVTGATGTGKEHVARAVHGLSARARGPFVAINCAAVPDSLFESEFFGFERGSFTGAQAAKKGQMSVAHGGTLFLDELAEMSLLAQTKLLRALETREVHPIGATRPHPVDIRVVAATNLDVEAEVERGRLRPDLYYRLNVARIDLPRLADRREDIGVYVEHFVSEFNARRRLNVARPSDALLSLLRDYDWPGNVREVRNFVEAVFIDPPIGAIDIGDIPTAFARLRRDHRQTGIDERQQLLAVLDRTNWNKAEAARELNWSRMTLYRKLSKHHIADVTPVTSNLSHVTLEPAPAH